MADSDSDEVIDAMIAEARASKLRETSATLRSADDIPMFMQNLTPGAMDNETIAALSALKYDGMTPEQIAEQLKTEGNEHFRKGTPKDLKEALSLYTEGLEQHASDSVLNGVLLSNRAAVHLKQRNYPGALADAHRALELDPGNLKAYYRGATAAFSLGKNDDAVSLSATGLERMRAGATAGAAPSAAETELAELHDKVSRFVRLKAEREAGEAAAAAAITNGLAERGIVLGEPMLGGRVEAQAGKIAFLPEYPGVMAFPVTLLYPEHGQLDYIDEFVETARFIDHLTVMFGPSAAPCEWDTKREYTARALAVYAVTGLSTPVDPAVAEWHRKTFGAVRRAVRIPLEMTLREALATAGYVLPGVAAFHVVVKGSKFARDFAASPMA